MHLKQPLKPATGQKAIRYDGLTDGQAVERKQSGLRLLSGKVERREFEDKRHDTLDFIINVEVATDQIGWVA